MITVLGATGFIGRHLATALERSRVPYYAPPREELLEGRSLGDVIYCTGVTGDFRSRPLDTVEAHVCRLAALLRSAEVESLVYLSSTRLYAPSSSGREDEPLQLSDPSDLYNLSKALGERVALSSSARVLILRLANVYGVDAGSANFLPSIIEDAIRHGRIVLRTSRESTRNYVAVEDVTRSTLALMDRRAEGIYNIAGDRNFSHAEITECIASLTGCMVEVVAGSPTETAPHISLARISEELEYVPESVMDALPRLVRARAAVLL